MPVIKIILIPFEKMLTTIFTRIYSSLIFLRIEGKSEKEFNFLLQAVRLLIGIMIFIKPFGLFTSIEEICLYFSLFFAIIYLHYFKNNSLTLNSPLTFPFLIFASWSLFNIIFAINKWNSLNDLWGHLVKYLAIYYILLNFFNSRKLFLIIAWLIVLSGTIFSLGAMVYFYLVLGNKFSTLFRIHNLDYGYFHFFVVFSFLTSLKLFNEASAFYQKLILIMNLIASPMIIIFSQTRSAILATIVGISFIFYRNKRILFLLIIMAISCYPLLSSFGNRLSLSTTWEHKNIRIGTAYLFLEIIKDFPLTGIGFSLQSYDESHLLEKYNQKVPSKYRQDPPVRSPHNLLIDVAVRLGLLGLGIFIFILFKFLKMNWILIKDGKDNFIKGWSLCLLSNFAAFFINAMAMDATFGIQAIVFYTLLAMVTILWRLQNAEKSISASAKEIIK